MNQIKSNRIVKSDERGEKRQCMSKHEQRGWKRGCLSIVIVITITIFTTHIPNTCLCLPLPFFFGLHAATAPFAEKRAVYFDEPR